MGGMVYLVIIGFGLAAFIVVLLYQLIFTVKMSLIERVLFLIILTGIIITSSYIRLQYVERGTIEAKILGPIAAPIEKSVEAIHQTQESKELEAVVLPIIEKAKGKYAVAIENLKTGETYELNENNEFASASLYKLWVMALVFQNIKDDKLSLDQTLTADVPTLNKRFDIDEENAELTEGTISLTIKNALEQMITVSANYPALLLHARVGIKNTQTMLNSYQLTSSHTGTPPMTTAKDIASFYKLLYNGKLIDEQSSQQMLEILKRQKLNDRIPKYLPNQTIIAHKTGELDGVKHDAGIVFTPKGDYIIVLMSDTANELVAAEIEANVSKAVWEYFNH
jgi:beta-lactamase class A